MPNRSYSFKEGLAMMAAKDVGIDPYLAAEAGEDARSILAALRRAKTAKGLEKTKHIAAAQSDLRKLNPKQHGKLINALQAKVLALQGRGGDTAVAHLEPGEMVVPRRVLTPELMQLIAAEAVKRGIDPKQLIVGSRKASINPATGAEEFGVGSDGELDMTGVGPVSVTRYPYFSDNSEVRLKEMAALETAMELAKKWEPERDKTGEIVNQYHKAPEGNLTNQYGVLVDNPGNLKKGDYSDPVAAKQAYLNKYGEFRKQLSDPSTDKLTSSQLGAVMDGVMNVGIGAFKGSEADKALRTGDHNKFAKEFSEFRMYTPAGKTEKNYSDGLENRRGDELDVFFGRNRIRQPGEGGLYAIPGGSPRKTGGQPYKPFPTGYKPYPQS